MPPLPGLHRWRRWIALAALLGAACGPAPEPPAAANGAGESRVRDLYLDLMQRTLTDLVYENDPKTRARLRGDVSSWYDALKGAPYDYPSRAHTMIGIERLRNIRTLTEDVLARGIPGDLIEAGAWRGGATIFMRAVLAAHGVDDRVVWVADSFEGLPPPNPELYPADAGLDLNEIDALAVSQEEVERNFERYGLRDAQVRFLKGWFKDSLPAAPIGALAIVRLDADLYESTMDAIVPLYPKLSPGGYLIVDDYKIIPACKQAIDDYRSAHGITAEIHDVDWNTVYWMKPPDAG